MISDPLLLLAFFFAVVAFTRALEKRFKFVERISSAVLCTLLGITFANIGLIPTTAASATNATVFEFAIPYTIEWTVQFWVYDEATSGPDPVLFYEVTVEKQNAVLACRRARGRGGITLWEVESCQVEKL